MKTYGEQFNILNIIYYFSPGVKHNDQDGDSFKKQCQLVKDASDFLITVQIPGFIRDCLDHSSAPMDGQTLSDNLHNRGINIRYIGVIANMLSKVPQLSYIHSISVSEVIVRSTKHIFTNFMQGLELTHLSVGIAHFLNCFLSRLVYYTHYGYYIHLNSLRMILFGLLKLSFSEKATKI